MEDTLQAHQLFIIGSEASKAMSPTLWNQVFEELPSNWTFQAWDVPDGYAMDAIRSRMLAPDVVAANVTMPHKQWAAKTADVLTEPVRLSGAANLLVRHNGRLSAHNTDITAVANLLHDRYQRHALMFGAGGAARGALVALSGRVGNVTITDKDPRASQQLLALAVKLGMNARAANWTEAQERAPEASLIVNATPIGKSTDDGPVFGHRQLAADAFVYDFVYADHETATIRTARYQGLECADGWQHLLSQATSMIPLLGLPPRTDVVLQSALARIRSVSLR